MGVCGAARDGPKIEPYKIRGISQRKHVYKCIYTNAHVNGASMFWLLSRNF